MEHAKIGLSWPFQIAICSMVLCIIPSNFRLIAEIPKQSERWRQSRNVVGDGQTDGQTAGRPAGRNDRRQYPSALMVPEGKHGILILAYKCTCTFTEFARYLTENHIKNKSRSTTTQISFVKSFWNFAQRTAIMLPCRSLSAFFLKTSVSHFTERCVIMEYALHFKQQ